jgi:hypothetical protein
MLLNSVNHIASIAWNSITLRRFDTEIFEKVAAAKDGGWWYRQEPSPTPSVSMAGAVAASSPILTALNFARNSSGPLRSMVSGKAMENQIAIGALVQVV